MLVSGRVIVSQKDDQPYGILKSHKHLLSSIILDISHVCDRVWTPICSLEDSHQPNITRG